jgi:hypothetical protein
MKYKVVFIFSHPMLFNVWKKAQELLKSEGIEITVVNQCAIIDWKNEVIKLTEEADAIYFSGIRHFANFNALVETCKKAPYVLPSGIEAASSFTHNDEQTVKIIDSYFKSGSEDDLANAARLLLYKSGISLNVPSGP